MRFHLGSRPRWRDVNGNGFLGMMTTMISHHKKRDNGDGSRSRERIHLHAQGPQVPQTQPMVTPEADEVSDEDFSDMNPSSPSAGPPPSAEQRGRSRRDERSRSRERAHPHSSSQYADEDSAKDPRNRVSGRSRSPQEQEGSRRQGPQKQKGKKTVAEKQPSEAPKAKKAQVY